MKCYASPYEGELDYLFFSYCHDDAARVYPIIERLAIEGFRVWYDDGIHPGEDWPDAIAEHLSRARTCVAAISKASAESHNCRNEVTFAVSHNKPFLSIVLEEFPMPLGMQMQLGNSRFIRKYDLQEDSFYSNLVEAPNIIPCRASGNGADAEALRIWKKHKEEYEESAPKKPIPNGIDIGPWFPKGNNTEKPKEKAEEEARKKAEEEARKRAEEEARKRAEEEARKRAKEEARKRAEKEAAKAAEEASVAEKRAGESALAVKRISGQETVSDEDVGKAAEYLRLTEQASRDAKEAAEAAKTAAKEAGTQRGVATAEAASESAASAKAYAKEAADAYETAKRKVGDGKIDDDEPTIYIKPDDEDGPTVREPVYKPALFVRLKTGESAFLKRENTVIGKKQERCDIAILGNPKISREHIELEWAGQELIINNLKPTNKTVVNGRCLEDDGSANLSPFSEIILADEVFLLLYGDAFDQVFDQQKICLLTSEKTGETKMITEDGLSLDRNHKEEWREEILYDRQISRNGHARVYCKHGQCYIQKIKAEPGKSECNAVCLNELKVQPGESKALYNGDLISVVDTEFIYHEIKIGA